MARSIAPARGRVTSAPASNTCRLLARDHAAPESTLALSKADQPCCGRVRPLAWCSRPRSSTALLEGALMANSDLAAVVMAAGLGTRMKSATPKHLHPLLGRRLVDWVVEAVRPLGPDPLVVVLSPAAAGALEGVTVA